MIYQYFFCRKEYFEQTITNVAFNLCETISLISAMRIKTLHVSYYALAQKKIITRHLNIICANLQNQMDLFSGSF